MTVSGVGRGLSALREGVLIALDALRASKTRAALTILGVAIGVAVVVAMAATVDGINSSFEEQLRQTGPTTFYVTRYFQGGLQVSDGTEETEPWRRNPPLSKDEALVIEALPSIAAVTVMEQSNASMDFGPTHISGVLLWGYSASYIRVAGGDVSPGRSFTDPEEESGARVVVLGEKAAGQLFGERDPIGKRVRIGAQQYTVIGVYISPPNLFGGGDQVFAILPHETLRKDFIWWNPFYRWMDFMVRPVEGVTVQQAIDDVTAAMRGHRGLRPGQDNNFAMITQDAIMNLWGQLTAVFFAVMVGLSSIGLMVGGVGVIAIMMISVTERIREIGVRKALGATRREILWQFLVEAATLTAVGGAVGLAVGGAGAWLLQHFTPIPARVPPWSIAVALLASVLTGVVFGLVPANKASRLDPVEALRYE